MCLHAANGNRYKAQHSLIVILIKAQAHYCESELLCLVTIVDIQLISTRKSLNRYGSSSWQVLAVNVRVKTCNLPHFIIVIKVIYCTSCLLSHDLDVSSEEILYRQLLSLSRHISLRWLWPYRFLPEWEAVMLPFSNHKFITAYKLGYIPELFLLIRTSE